MDQSRDEARAVIDQIVIEILAAADARDLRQLQMAIGRLDGALKVVRVLDPDMDLKQFQRALAEGTNALVAREGE